MRNAEGGTAKRGAVSHRPAKKPVVLSQRVINKEDIKPAFPLGPAGLQMWEEAIPTLMSFNAAQVLDVYNLTLMCSFWQEIVTLRQVLDADGHYDIGSTGQMRRSPVKDDYNYAVKEFNRLSAQYGMTLASRTGLALTDVTTRSLESDLNSRLGVNPRRTNRTPVAQAKKQIEAGDKE
jgi:P27 family predicted phage terminase small subunit